MTLYIFKSQKVHIMVIIFYGHFENFNKRNFSYSTIRKFLNGIHKEEDIKIFMKDTIAVVVNGGKEFFVTKDIYNNDCDNLDLTISKKLEYMNEKIKIQNNDEKNNKMYKIKYYITYIK